MERQYVAIDLNNAEKIVMPKKLLRTSIINLNPL